MNPFESRSHVSRPSRVCAAVLLAALVATSSACVPLGPLPGRTIGGALVQAPQRWPARRVAEVNRVETRDAYGARRTHNVWAVVVDGHLYVAGRASNGWVERALANPLVRFRSGDALYVLRAVRVDHAPTLAAVDDAYGRKYPDRIEEVRAAWAEHGHVVFELAPASNDS